MLHALFCRFDDRDSALLMTVHHSVSDGWSSMVIFRDLGAFYAARVSGTAPALPPMRQYREYAEWQQATATNTDDDGALKYWAGQLDGAKEFVLPNDHGHPEKYSRPYSLHVFKIDAETGAGAAALANSTRATVFTVLLSAAYVLAHQITGATDLAVRAFTAGRNELEFHNTMGLFLNVLPFRTEITSLLIITKLEEFDYTGAAVIAMVMLVASFTLLFAINLLQKRSLHWLAKGAA